jgi:hypothetical protein
MNRAFALAGLLAVALSVASLPACATSGPQEREPASASGLPVVCTLTPEQLESARAGLIPGLVARAESVTDLDDGLRIRFATQPGLLAELAAMIESERACCRFLRFQLTAEPAAGAIVLDVTGPPGTREMLRAL